MSTEQAAGVSGLDARSDLYSLGATAYFLLTGRAPFERPTKNLLIAAHLGEVASPPHVFRSEVPADLSAVVMRCLEKEPGRRYADAASLERALSECACAGAWGDAHAIQAMLGDEDGKRVRCGRTTELPIDPQLPTEPER
jgi:serine/threonine-protein kinase